MEVKRGTDLKISQMRKFFFVIWANKFSSLPHLKKEKDPNKFSCDLQSHSEKSSEIPLTTFTTSNESDSITKCWSKVHTNYRLMTSSNKFLSLLSNRLGRDFFFFFFSSIKVNVFKLNL